jgi:hypothetical protein
MRLIGFALLGLVLGGCGAKKVPVGPLSGGKISNNVNDWIAIPPNGCTVGSAAIEELMPQNARSQSGTMGRNELAKSIKTKLQGIAKVYMASVVADGKMTQEQNLTEAARSITDQDLYGSRVVRTKTTGGDVKIFHSLVCIDADALQDALGKMANVSEAARAAIQARAKAEFKDLDVQLDKINAE